MLECRRRNDSDLSCWEAYESRSSHDSGSRYGSSQCTVYAENTHGLGDHVADCRGPSASTLYHDFET